MQCREHHRLVISRVELFEEHLPLGLLEQLVHTHLVDLKSLK